jgi:hypothetical protein
MKRYEKLCSCLMIIALCVSGLMLGACKRTKKHRTEVTAGAAVNAMMMTNPMGSLFGKTQLSDGGAGSPSRAPEEVTGVGCPAINVGLNLQFNPLPNIGGTIDLAYNNSCIVNGLQMSGEVTSTWQFVITNLLPLNLTLNSTVTFDNLTMEGMHTDGTITQVISVKDAIPNSLINGTLTTTHADGKSRSMEFDNLTAKVTLNNYTVFQQFFDGASITITDNDTPALVINGNAQYTDEDDMKSQMAFDNVTQPFGCVMPASGKLHLVNDLKGYDAIVDYGDGTCDTLITVTLKGQDPEVIDVADWIKTH